MKQYGMRYLYKHLGEALKELPFEITNHNKVVAVVMPPGREITQMGIDKASVSFVRFFADGTKQILNKDTNEWEDQNEQNE